MSDPKAEIRALLAPVTGGTTLLPGGVVAEVVDFSNPKPYEDAPAWLLGSMNWNNWTVPVISFAMLAGTSKKEEPGPRSRVLIVKSLSQSSSVSYLGLLICGVPRLVKVKSASLSESKKLPGFPCVFSEIMIDKERVLVPDLDEMTRLVESKIDRKNRKG